MQSLRIFYHPPPNPVWAAAGHPCAKCTPRCFETLRPVRTLGSPDRQSSSALMAPPPHDLQLQVRLSIALHTKWPSICLRLRALPFDCPANTLLNHRLTRRFADRIPGGAGSSPQEMLLLTAAFCFGVHALRIGNADASVVGFDTRGEICCPKAP